MNIVIMRHAEAETFAASDAQRRLTRRGLQQATLAGQCLQQLSMSFDQAWVSPYRRTQQTADAVLASLAPCQRQSQVALQPDGDVVAVLERLEAVSVETLLIISHQPLVSHLVAALESTGAGDGPPMSPASMALLTAESLLPGCCQLQWLRHAPHFEAGRP